MAKRKNQQQQRNRNNQQQQQFENEFAQELNLNDKNNQREAEQTMRNAVEREDEDC